MSKAGANEPRTRDEPPPAADSGHESFAGELDASAGFIGALALELVKVTAQEVEAEWTVDKRHLQPHGVVHGGVYCSVVETCCSIGAQLAAAPGERVVGVDNHTSFVRVAREGRLHARATPLHVGRRAQLWECMILDASGRLIATGRLRLMSVGGAGSERDAS